ncbi:MAG: hypothetical protein HYU04_01320 [Candidatus Wildermuthbacteria bacterium]|nr:hypothetical protein [Candidatus Wildermuthbacteria bacterium]
MAEKPNAAKEHVLKVLGSFPPGFRLTIGGVTYEVAVLLVEVEKGSNLGRQAIGMAEGLVPGPFKNQLGKRYLCLVCGATVLCTKASSSSISCCEQPMALQEPRKLPSSD